MPKSIFHIITKDPQVKHVTDKVKPPRMHEHGAKQRYKVTGRVGKKSGRNESPAINKSLARGEFDQKY